MERNLTNESKVIENVQVLAGERSLTLVLPKKLAAELGVGNRDFLKCYVDGNRLIVEKVNPIRLIGEKNIDKNNDHRIGQSDWIDLGICSNCVKKLDENDLVRKWPKQFRDELKFTNHDLGILDVLIQGKTEITAEDLEEMKKFGYIFDGMAVSTHIDKVDAKDEDDMSGYLMTLVSFRRYQAPPLENDGRSDKKALKKTKPRQTETGFAPQESVCSGDAVGPDNHQGDDMGL